MPAGRSRCNAGSVPEASSAALASMLMGENTSPTQAAVRAERLIAVQRALA